MAMVVAMIVMAMGMTMVIRYGDGDVDDCDGDDCDGDDCDGDGDAGCTFGDILVQLFS